NIRKISDEKAAEAKKAEKPAAPAAAPASIGPRDYTITVNNRPYNVSVSEAGGVQATPAAAAAAPAPTPEPVVEGTDIEAPTPGNIVKILVDVGAEVTEDQPLVVMEAMKMESEVKSSCAGKVLAIHVAAGDTVQASDLLFTIG
ncbi:MAG: biotin attachment protein, partial [Gammaproteobacteria bacterium]|nr:biotin attachment protein [Gammaproteobacteria bacterium]